MEERTQVVQIVNTILQDIRKLDVRKDIGMHKMYLRAQISPLDFTYVDAIIFNLSVTDDDCNTVFKYLNSNNLNLQKQEVDLEKYAPELLLFIWITPFVETQFLENREDLINGLIASQESRLSDLLKSVDNIQELDL